MRQTKVPSYVNLAAGIWLILSPFVLGYAWIDAAVWNDVIVGVLVAALAFGRLGRLGTWSCWAMVVLGIWQVLAPAMYGYGDLGLAYANAVFVGLLIVAMAIWSAYANPYLESRRHPTFTSAEPSDDDLPPTRRRNNDL